MYNGGSINISYHNGDLLVQIKKANLSGEGIGKRKPTPKGENTLDDNLHLQYENSISKYKGKVNPSCEGYIIIDDDKQETFEFSEENQEIVWTAPDTRAKWMRGCY